MVLVSNNNSLFQNNNNSNGFSIIINNGSYDNVATTNNFKRKLNINKSVKSIMDYYAKISYGFYDITYSDSIKTEFKNIALELLTLKMEESGEYDVLRKNIVKTMDTLYKWVNHEINSSNSVNLNNNMISKMMARLQDFIDRLNREKLQMSLEDQLKQLYKNVGVQLESLLTNYARGNFDKIKEDLDNNVFENLAVALYNEKNDELEYYEFIRLLLVRSLEGIKQSIILNTDQTEKIENLLRELNQIKNPIKNTFISASSTLDTIATIRKEYKQYIELYGIPENGVFDADKLAEIIKKI